MKKGFTILELIFTIVIIGILSSLAVPRLSSVHTDAVSLSDILNERAAATDAAREELHKNRPQYNTEA